MTDSKEVYSFTAFNDDYAFSDDGYFTYSSTEQKRVEDSVSERYKEFLGECMEDIEETKHFTPVLHRSVHIHYICRTLVELGRSFQAMDASRPWFCYWGMHSLRLLRGAVDDSLTSNVVRFLKTCESPTGGYGGGPGQAAHLATTYGAVMALVSIGTEEALNSINRKTLREYLLAMKQKDGSFRVHKDGEVDIRGAYCALAVASITNMLDEEISSNVESFIMSCQTYEGGFGGVSGCEAHGGYTFCGVAALMILGKSTLMHTPSLFKWLGNKQMKFEGGFQGRTNKLVDSCYSFWQAAVFPMMQVELGKRSTSDTYEEPFDAKALQEFVLVMAQDQENGGFRDKPDKVRDLYHTCYALSGLAIAQTYTPNDVVGGANSRLEHISPVYNVVKSAEQRAKEFFSQKDKK